MALLSRFFGRAASEGAAFALGTATGPVLRPAVQDLQNEAWKTHASRPVGVNDAAEVVAEDVELASWGRGEANQTGFSNDRFDALTAAVRNAPSLDELFALWRRGLIEDADFVHGLRKARLEGRWDGPLRNLKDVLLSPAELANARQQGFVSPDRQRAEAGLQGLNGERADIQFETVGLPPGPAVAQHAANRGLIDRATFDQMIREGHTKTKYTDLEWELRVPVLSAAEYAGLHLRGWITAAEMNAGGALTGYTPEQMNLLFLNRGRPMAPVQMYTAWARRLDGPRGVPFDEQDFLKAIAQSDIRPEYGPTLWANRFAYPTLFQLGRLVTAGAITPERARIILRNERYEQEEIDALVTFWTQGSAAKADPHIAKAQVQLWTTTHRSYLAGEISKTVATNALGRAGVAVAARVTVIGTWDAEKALIRAQLTPANVKKAFQKGSRNNATGSPWTRDEALAALVELGYAPLAANDYLDIP